MRKCAFTVLESDRLDRCLHFISARPIQLHNTLSAFSSRNMPSEGIYAAAKVVLRRVKQAYVSSLKACEEELKASTSKCKTLLLVEYMRYLEYDRSVRQSQ